MCRHWKRQRVSVCTLALCFALLISNFAFGQPGAGPAPIVATPVVQQTVTAAQTFVGSVLPVQRATIGSAVDGRVVECPFDEGDRVAKGQKLAQLLTETINLELAAAKAELDYRRHQLVELENGTRPEEVEQARARMASSLARRDFMNTRLDRLRSSLKTRAVSEDEFEETEAMAIEASEAHLEAQSAYQLAVEGPRQELLAQARAQVAMQEAVADKLADQIAKYTIKSRFDGYVVEQLTEEGEWLNRGDLVAEVVAIDEVDVVVQVVEQSVPFVKPGTTVRVEVPALPDRILEGTVVSTVPQADMRARTFPVKVRLRNEINASGPLLMPGMYARVALPVGQQQSAMLVPKDAIVLGEQKPLIYAVAGATKQGDSGQAKPVPVELGVSHGALIQVIGALEVGQLVVVQGNERLRPGQPVIVNSLQASATN